MEPVPALSGSRIQSDRKHNQTDDRKTGDQSDEKERKMLYKQGIVMAAI